MQAIAGYAFLLLGTAVTRIRLSLQVLVTALLLSWGSVSHAALITNINGLLIGTTNYDITFHSGTTFNALWDANGDGVYGDGTLNAGPTFLGDISGASLAVTAIMGLLGDSDTTTVGGSDSFIIPYLKVSTSYFVAEDSFDSLTTDTLATTQGYVATYSHVRPWASFSPSAPIPEPTAAALLTLGLLGINFARKRRRK